MNQHNSSSTDTDEFDAYDLAELTAEDFDQLDASVAAFFDTAASPSESQAIPPPDTPLPGDTNTRTIRVSHRIEVEYEGEGLSSKKFAVAEVSASGLDGFASGLNVRTVGFDQSGDESSRPKRQSPFQQFRWLTKALSVTDLSAPSWCEVQFDYGLRQRRTRPIENRPTSFVSREGKQIQVQKEVAVKNDTIQKTGQAIHKKLEKEIKTKEIVVETESSEEKFAVRMLNMLWGLDCILEHGFTREMPVFGIIHDHLVFGIIDEISRSPVPASTSSPKKGKKISKPLSSSQSQITSFLPPSPSKSNLRSTPSQPSIPSSSQIQPYVLNIIDAKSRRAAGIPSLSNSTPSRLQLMLYHLLLSDLISTHHKFPFDYLWQKLKLDPSQPFSDRFLTESGLGWGEVALNLHDLGKLWEQKVRWSNVRGVAEDLKLVYYSQKPKKGRTKRGASPSSESASSPESNAKRAKSNEDKGDGSHTPTRGSIQTPDPVSMQEALDIATAIRKSLNDTSHDMSSDMAPGEPCSPGIDADLDLAIAESLRSYQRSHKDSSSGPHPAGVVIVDDSLSSSCKPNTEAKPAPKSLLTELSNGSEIIGSTTFKMDPSFLDDHLVSVLEYWSGEREPIGVSIENVGRCMSCEYRDDCEWREKKALEIQLQRNQKNPWTPKSPPTQPSETTPSAQAEAGQQ